MGGGWSWGRVGSSHACVGVCMWVCGCLFVDGNVRAYMRMHVWLLVDSICAWVRLCGFACVHVRGSKRN